MILRTAKRMEESGVRQLDGFDADDAEFQAELVRRRFRSLRGSGAVGAIERIAMRNGITTEGERWNCRNGRSTGERSRGVGNERCIAFASPLVSNWRLMPSVLLD